MPSSTDHAVTIRFHRRAEWPLPSSGIRRWGLAGSVRGRLLLVIGLFTSSSTVQAGHVGVVTTFGSVEPARAAARLPLCHAVRAAHRADRYARLPHTFKQIDAASQELQSVKLTGTMNYHLDPERAYELYQNVGLEFANNIIDPAFSDFIKEVVPQYKVTDILIKRDEIRGLAQAQAGRQPVSATGSSSTTSISRTLPFRPTTRRRSRRSRPRSRQVETERQILEQKRIQAEQNVAEAEGKARPRSLPREGEADANQRQDREHLAAVDRLPALVPAGMAGCPCSGRSQPLITVPLIRRSAGRPRHNRRPARSRNRRRNRCRARSRRRRPRRSR